MVWNSSKAASLTRIYVAESCRLGFYIMEGIPKIIPKRLSDTKIILV